MHAKKMHARVFFLKKKNNRDLFGFGSRERIGLRFYWFRSRYDREYQLIWQILVKNALLYREIIHDIYGGMETGVNVVYRQYDSCY